tara:strand:+ start:1175 stop:1483 length:309 start_codon:yes stop_codon:yes gene_type:complete
MSSKDLSHHIVKYWKIFAILLVCTVFTVLAAETNFDVENSIAGGIFVGLTIAVIKGYLVASNFMHLNDEKKIIYWILLLTVIFLVALLFIPVLWESTLVGKH